MSKAKRYCDGRNEYIVLNNRCKNGFTLSDKNHAIKYIQLSDGSCLRVELRFKLDVRSADEHLWRVCADVIRSKNSNQYVICSTCDIKFPNRLKEKQTKSLVTATKVVTPIWLHSMLEVHAPMLLMLLPNE